MWEHNTDQQFFITVIRRGKNDFMQNKTERKNTKIRLEQISSPTLIFMKRMNITKTSMIKITPFLIAESSSIRKVQNYLKILKKKLKRNTKNNYFTNEIKLF